MSGRKSYFSNGSARAANLESYSCLLRAKNMALEKRIEELETELNQIKQDNRRSAFLQGQTE